MTQWDNSTVFLTLASYSLDIIYNYHIKGGAKISISTTHKL